LVERKGELKRDPGMGLEILHSASLVPGHWKSSATLGSN
jgi:hypothetical protein